MAGIYLQRLRLAGEAMLRDAGQCLGVRLAQDLGRELEGIVAAGIRVTFVFARGEPGIDLLKIQGGSALTRLGERCRVRIVESGDHIFSRREPRTIMEHVLSEELFTRADIEAIHPTRPHRPRFSKPRQSKPRRRAGCGAYAGGNRILAAQGADLPQQGTVSQQIANVMRRAGTPL